MSCKCHDKTFCPDEICIGYDDDDVPIYVRRDSDEGIKQALFSARKDGELDELIHDLLNEADASEELDRSNSSIEVMRRAAVALSASKPSPSANKE